MNKEALIKKKSVRKLKRFLLWSFVSVTLLATIAIIGTSVYIGWSLTHPDKKPLDDDPSSYGINYEAFSVPSQHEEILLHGWHLKAEEAKGIVIMAHGYRNNRLESGVPALALANDLIQHQFDVVMFDFRNAGISEGKLTSVGYFEKDDLISVVQYIKEEEPDMPVGVIGFSMGAATALVAAEQAPSIEAIVADSSFANLREYLEVNLPYWSDLPHFPFTFIIMNTLPFLNGLDVDAVSPRDAIKQLSIPILLIHGDEDIAIPYHNSEEIYQNGDRDYVQLWIPQGSGHVKAYADHPEEYRDRVLQFLRSSLLKDTNEH